MPLAGFVAVEGKLSLTGAIAAGTLGSILGAFPWYFLGKYVGEKRLNEWADRYGKWLSLSSQDVAKSKGWFNRYGKAIVFFGRLLPGIRTYISIPAGLEAMNLVQFLIYSTLGTAAWSAILTYAGYLLGQNYRAVEKYIAPMASSLTIALFLALLGWSCWRLAKRDRTAS